MKILFYMLKANLDWITLSLNIAEHLPSKCIKGTITKELLAEYYIQEPVPIHNLINMYWGIGRFCNDGEEL